MEKGFHGVIFRFPCGPCDYLLAGCLLEEVMITDPLFVLHMSPQQLPRPFFFFIIMSSTNTCYSIVRCHLK